jgi:prolyl oligopeptidase
VPRFDPALFVLAPLVLFTGWATAPQEPRPVSRPETPRQEVVDLLHGIPVPDPYRWLESPKDPPVAAWMDAQDAAARAALGAVPARARFAARLRELAYVDSVGVPVKRGTRYFFSRKPAKAEKAIWYWKEGHDGEERVLLDPHTLSPDGSISVGVVAPSWDGRLVAFSLKQRGEDKATLHLLETDTGQRRPDTIPGARYAYPDWTPDGRGFYYTWLPTDPSIPVDQLPGYAEVRFHAVGTDPAADPLVHPRTGDPTSFIGAALSHDGRWLVVSISHGWVANDVYYKDLAAGDAGWRTLVEGVRAQFSVVPFGGRFFVQTDDGAPRGRVMVADPAYPERAGWREVVPEHPSAALQATQVVGGRLVLSYLENAASAIRIHGTDGRFERAVALPGIGSASGFSGQEGDDEAFFSFSSFTFPPEIYRTGVASGETEVWARIEVPVDPSRFVVEQVWYPSKDGTQVSMFLVHGRDLERNGENPCLLYGYGGFNVSLTPSFNAYAYPWLEAGGMLAIPNLRGGGEYGEAWHRAGMLERKQNVFDDYLAAAEWLVREGYTRPEKLAIRGGSNGGLLVGAAMVQRPELFRAVVCQVPLLDMVRYHLFGSGRTWIEEYGSADDPAQFATLFAYSPYHRVKDGTAYPALLMMSADSDDRVDPMHARKFTAAIQAAQADPSRPALLRLERNAGHGGADLRRQEVESYADIYAFLAAQLGNRGQLP